MPGALVSMYSLTVTPWSIASPAFSASGDTWAHADADHHQVGVERAAALERRTLAVDCSDAVLEMEFDTMLFMQRTDEVAELRTEYTLERAFFPAPPRAPRCHGHATPPQSPDR